MKNKKIAGAGIDVFDVEPPLPDHSLLPLDNVVATPHTAGGTHEAALAMSRATAERFERIIGFRSGITG